MSMICQKFGVSILGAVIALGVVGCANQRPDVIPASAQLHTSGNGPINFTAPSDGTAYIYDASTSRLLWSGAVRGGQMVIVDPQKNQIAVGSQVVATRTVQPGDRTDVYFESMPGAQPAGDRQPVTPNYGNAPQGAGANSGTSANGQGLIVTPSVTVTPNNSGQQQQPPANQP